MTDRHEKWVRVEPGTVIPAGQPHCVKYVEEYDERVPESDAWFIDPSWKPPLVLPTEWTWAIVVHTGSVHPDVGRWNLNGGRLYRHTFADPYNVLDFIPLTEEQIARIEAAR